MEASAAVDTLASPVSRKTRSTRTTKKQPKPAKTKHEVELRVLSTSEATPTPPAARHATRHRRSDSTNDAEPEAKPQVTREEVDQLLDECQRALDEMQAINRYDVFKTIFDNTSAVLKQLRMNLETRFHEEAVDKFSAVVAEATAAAAASPVAALPADPRKPAKDSNSAPFLGSDLRARLKQRSYSANYSSRLLVPHQHEGEGEKEKKKSPWEMLSQLVHRDINTPLLLRQILCELRHSLYKGASVRTPSQLSADRLLQLQRRLEFVEEMIHKGEFLLLCEREQVTYITDTLSSQKTSPSNFSLTDDQRNGYKVVIRRARIASDAVVRKNVKRIGDLMTTTTATFFKSSEYSNMIAKRLMLMTGFMYYYSNNNALKSKVQQTHVAAQTDKGALVLRKFWNQLDDPGPVHSLAGLTFSGCHHRKISIVSSTRHDQHQQSIDALRHSSPPQHAEQQQPQSPTSDQHSSGSGSNSSSSHGGSPSHDSPSSVNGTTHDTQLEISPRNEDEGSGSSGSSGSMSMSDDQLPMPPKQEPSADHITARILSLHSLPCWGARTTKRVLIVHFHGGGFIAMSSYSHQSYTRLWCKQNGYPILSIDYRLAPEHKYPTAMLDCWDSYRWAVEHSHEVLGAEPQIIIVTGDSAGGNLAAAVTLKAIAENYRIPDGVVLSYPALNLARNVVLPSRLLSLNDAILPYSFLEMCLLSYLPSPDYDVRRDPFVAPSYASDAMLSKFPPTFIGVGDNDPLYHDSIEFAKALHWNKRLVHITEYRDLPHGYLSFTSLFAQASKCVKEAARWMRWLVDKEYSWMMNYSAHLAMHVDSDEQLEKLGLHGASTAEQEWSHLIEQWELIHATQPPVSLLYALPAKHRVVLYKQAPSSTFIKRWYPRTFLLDGPFLYCYSMPPKIEFRGCLLLRRAKVELNCKSESTRGGVIQVTLMTAMAPGGKHKDVVYLSHDSRALVLEWALLLQEAAAPSAAGVSEELAETVVDSACARSPNSIAPKLVS